jgi:hypothetical protein
MEKKDWSDYINEDLIDEINLLFQVMDMIQENQALSEKDKQNIIDDCLDKLNSLYDEQRKRGTFKRNS